MPAAPDGDLGRAPARRAAAPSEPVTSATRVPSSAPSSSPARPSGAEQVEHAAVVLGGEHLGRRQQRRLPAGVDHLQHRPQRAHASCPSRPRPAAAGASGAAAARSAAISSPTVALAARSARTAARRRTRPAARRRAAAGAAPASRPPGACAAPGSAGRRTPRPTSAGACARYSASLLVGRWISRSAGAEADQLAAGPHGRRQRVGRRREACPAPTRTQRGDHPGRHRRGGRVDRDQRAGELLDLLAGRRLAVAALAEQDVLRAVELPLAPELGDLAGEQPPPAGAQLALAPRLVGRRSASARRRSRRRRSPPAGCPAAAASGAPLVRCTWASTVTCSPTSSERMSVCSPRSS